MHLPLQHVLKRQLLNMHGRHPVTAIGQSNIFNKRVGLLLGDHARAGATPSKCPTEMTLAVAVGHHNGVVQAFTLEEMHYRKGLRVGGGLLIIIKT